MRRGAGCFSSRWYPAEIPAGGTTPRPTAGLSFHRLKNRRGGSGRVRTCARPGHTLRSRKREINKLKNVNVITEATRPRFVGLTPEEVEESRKKYGANILTPPTREPWWKLLLEKFEDPIIRILLIAAVIAILVGLADGKYFEGVGIILAILLATTLAFLNEYKAAKEFDILNRVNENEPVKVIRGRNYTTIPRRDVVVGDIVLVETGEEPPADGELLEAMSLRADEAALTGEAVPVSKHARGAAPPSAREERTFPADRLLFGTKVLDGHGVIRVNTVGDATELGKTARAAAEFTGKETPLNEQLNRLSKLIGVIGFAVATLLFVALCVRDVLTGNIVLTGPQWAFAALLGASAAVTLARVWAPVVFDGLELMGSAAEPPAWLENDSLAGWLKTLGLGAALLTAGTAAGYFGGLLPADVSWWLPRHAAREFLNFFMIAVTLIVVAVPEGLAMSVTLSLAYSMRKMTASNNLVRRMHACETIGAATVICSDKTGTLTLNEMRVHAFEAPALAGSDGRAAALLAEAVAANTTAQLSRSDGGPKPLGNPTEGALLMWLEEQGSDYVLLRDAFRIAKQLTFSTERKFMGTLGTSGVMGHTILHVKGAPEVVLERCTQVLTASCPEPVAPHAETIRERLKEYQARGMRTLAFAYCETKVPAAEADIEELAQSLTWLGFAIITDPVRDEVPYAVRVCREAGIGVKMITGDSQHTAQEIARQIGLLDGLDDQGAHMGGREFAELDDEQAREAAGRIKVLSRARPMDKLRLVKLLQEQLHVVAVTGDGVNDGPALNFADVGLAMGKTGKAVAKEASDIILLDDSFDSITKAVMWGRSLYENIQRFILFQLTVNVVALGIALVGPFIGVKLPLTVTQMLWVNLIMDTFAALALATEPPQWGVMRRPPRRRDDFIITRSMAINILLTGLLFLSFLIGLLLYLQGGAGLSEETAEGRHRLSIFFSIFVFLQFWNLFNAKCLGRVSSALSGLWVNKSFLLIALAISVGQILLVQYGGDFFRTAPLSLSVWVYIIGGTSVVIWVGEAARMVRRRRHRWLAEAASA
jgi:Ca2+-transporting ATPase